ncbi:glucosyltransferase domain-containing protein [Ureibacillus chungkukjangi]|uniref:glucosyltransferase domain-containing protein n=1 Tax=Ureibacillus chungkukjangi TaxID=1202712 RepID=UPI00203A3FE7|nr:glucosyltransferase domain-containing protein [Ureibacillus chungkukjangi]MCM3389130.1 glucosyltransferase domain-containing protein [Ureibacillus chungkukjangi]
MPEEILGKLRNKVKSEWLLAFSSAMIIGLLTHLYIFTHRFPNHDGLHNFYSTQAMVTSGRFFLGPASSLSSYFDLPWVIGLFSLFFLALTSICLVILFDIKKRISIVLISGLVVTFPSVSSTFAYMFTADGYMLGIFMATLAVVLTKKYRYGFILGAILVSLAVGVYQANLSVALVFATFWIIQDIFFSNHSVMKIWGNIIKSGLMVGIGMVGYFIVYKLFTSFLSVQISSYQGLDKVGSLTIHDIPKRISQIVSELKTFFFRGFFTDYNVNFLELLNVLIFILILIGCISLILKKKLYINIGKLATLLLCVITLPFTLYIAYFASPNVFYHMLMVFSLSSIYIFLVLIYDAIDSNQTSIFKEILSWGTTILIALTVFNFALIANIAYMNMELRYEKSVSFANRLVDRIEQLDEYDTIEKMAVFGNVELHSTLSSVSIPSQTPTMTGTVGETVFYKPYSYTELIETFLGYSLVPASEEDLLAIQQTNFYKEMGVWPAQDSVRVINNTVVVKFENLETNE